MNLPPTMSAIAATTASPAVSPVASPVVSQGVSNGVLPVASPAGWVIAQAEQPETTTQDVQGHYGNLIFMGVFFIALLIVGIWWLKRGA